MLITAVITLCFFLSKFLPKNLTPCKTLYPMYIPIRRNASRGRITHVNIIIYFPFSFCMRIVPASMYPHYFLVRYYFSSISFIDIFSHKHRPALWPAGILYHSCYPSYTLCQNTAAPTFYLSIFNPIYLRLFSKNDVNFVTAFDTN